MSNIHNLVVGLERKILLLKQQMELLSEENQRLSQEKEVVLSQNIYLEKELQSWQQKYEAAKLTNTILGSDDNKTDTKIKINTLIREIDICIKQLSEK